MNSKLEPIPHPPEIPFLGNVNDIDGSRFTESLAQLADKYGPIFSLNILGKTQIILSSYELAAEVYDDERFDKSLEGFDDLREVVHDGLFTAQTSNEEWAIAHRVLIPAFGPMMIRRAFGGMHEIATQLALKWARSGPSTPITIGPDFTRLALDTVALCSMGFRFNSFYKESMHPMVAAMYGVLTEAAVRTTRFLPKIFYRAADIEFKKNIKTLQETAMQVVQERKKNGQEVGEQHDLLDAMLKAVDAKTGYKMTDENIVDNLITFLIAGHETTGSTLTCIIYRLLDNPEQYSKAQQEVDEILGKRAIKVDDFGKFKYLTAVIRETLRYNPPLQALGREARKEEVIGGKYEIKPSDAIFINFRKTHFDPKVFGDDADKFDPERMYEEKWEELMKEYPHCLKTFGVGARACIGRPFAMQEMILNLAVLLQNFNFVMDDPSYIFKTVELGTTKPTEFQIRAMLRDGLTPAKLEARLAGAHMPENEDLNGRISTNGSKPSATNGKPIAIFYGSDTGTCEFMAHQLAKDAPRHGFSATVDVLDAAKESLPKDRPVAIITSTYEGQPPANARHFINWIESLHGDELTGVNYSVYGCGHSDWVNTFQRIPKLVDDILEKRGAKRLVPRKHTNGKDRDMFSDFEDWADKTFWPSIEAKYGKPEGEVEDFGLSVSFSTPRTSILRHEVSEAVVLESKSLVGAGVLPQKRHMEILLPSNAEYAAGDYLAVLPHNPKELVSRVMKRFGFAWDAHVKISGLGSANLPTDTSMPVETVLSAYVELSQVVTRRNVVALGQLADGEDLKTEFESLAGDDYESEVRAKKLSIIDILEAYPRLALPFNIFLQMLPPMRVRQYSISSSPLASFGKVTISYSVLDTLSMSGSGHRHMGVATTYLSSLSPHERIQVAIRKSPVGFRLPANPGKPPIVCIGVGTGLAPFRAFTQERYMLLKNGQKLAPAMLFVGCRYPEIDEIYAEEMKVWEAAGAVKIYRAFSRQPDQSEGCKYVQHRLWHERAGLMDMYEQGARFYVCGSGRMASDVKDMFVQIMMEHSERKGKPMSDAEVQRWFESMRNERYATDVFD